MLRRRYLRNEEARIAREISGRANGKADAKGSPPRQIKHGLVRSDRFPYQ